MRFNSKKIIQIIIPSIICIGFISLIINITNVFYLSSLFALLLLFIILLYEKIKQEIINNNKNEVIFSSFIDSQTNSISLTIKEDGTVDEIFSKSDLLPNLDFKTIIDLPDNEIEKKEIISFVSKIWYLNSAEIIIHKSDLVLKITGQKLSETKGLKNRAIINITNITIGENRAKELEILLEKYKQLERNFEINKTLKNDFSKILNQSDDAIIIYSISPTGFLDKILFINENAKKEVNYFESTNIINSEIHSENKLYQKLSAHNFLETSVFEDRYIDESDTVFDVEAKYNFDTSSIILKIHKSLNTLKKSVENELDIYISNFKHSPDGAIIFDTKGTSLYINNSMIDILKLEKKDNMLSILEYINQTGDIDSSDYIADVINSNNSTTTQIYKLKNNSAYYISTFHPLFNKSGKIQFVLRLTYKTKESELEEYYTETSLSFENILRTNILANFSHEIRTSMNSILGTADILENYSTNEDEKEYINLIKRSGEDVHSLLESFRLFTTLNNKTLLPTIVNFTLSELIEKVEKETVYIKERFSKQDLDINFLVLPEMLGFKVKNDKENITNILIKLVENAIKYTDEGYVNIGFNTFNERQLTIWVEDSGVGISKTIMPTIFIPFSSTNPINNSSAGIGIGLAIAKELTELIGGNIEVESFVGKGTKFLINIPIGYTKKQIEATDDTKIKILIAQYGYTFDKELKNYLKQKEITVFNTNKGSDAIEIVSENKDISIVFTDINHTDITGLELAKALKRISPNIIIVAQAPYFILEEKIKLLNNGFNDYLVKPIFNNQFIKTIEKFMPEITN